MMNSKTLAYVGIDVAFAKKKRLPICICTFVDGKLTPLPLRTSYPKPPIGSGNVAALESKNVSAFANEVAAWLADLELAAQIKIARIAIDAPLDYAGPTGRACETDLQTRGISYIKTPTLKILVTKISEAKAFIANGGSEANLPGANLFWMLIGFELFKTLNKDYQCIEVFPQAIIHTLGCNLGAKTTEAGFKCQLAAFAARIGYTVPEAQIALKTLGFGQPHDQLDAWMSAWIASLPESKRKPLGNPPQDAIWIPI